MCSVFFCICLHIAFSDVLCDSVENVPPKIWPPFVKEFRPSWKMNFIRHWKWIHHNMLKGYWRWDSVKDGNESDASRSELCEIRSPPKMNFSRPTDATWRSNLWRFICTQPSIFLYPSIFFFMYIRTKLKLKKKASSAFVQNLWWDRENVPQKNNKKTLPTSTLKSEKKRTAKNFNHSRTNRI